MTPTTEQIEQARDEYHRALARLEQLGLAEVAAGFPAPECIGPLVSGAERADGDVPTSITPTPAPAETPRGKRRKTRARRSGGSVYLRGGVYWIKYFADGRPIRESSRSAKREDAEHLLDTRRGQRAKGEPISPKATKLTVGELLDNFVRRYQIDRHHVQTSNIARLRAAFGFERAVSVAGSDWNRYLEKHRRPAERPAGLSNVTLNRDGATLKRAYSLAREDFRGFTTRLEFSGLAESAPRSGFFEPDQFAAVLRHLPPDLRPVAEFGYQTGWRRGEVLGLTWARVSFEDAEVRLNPGETKSGEGRVFPFTAELRAILEGQRATTDAVQRRTGQIIAAVFYRDGRPILDFQKAWKSACRAAGVPGRLFHDFRRSAVRRFEQAGTPRSVAMKLTGHRTEAVYRRYSITSPNDLRVAAAILSGGVGTNRGHSAALALRPREGGGQLLREIAGAGAFKRTGPQDRQCGSLGSRSRSG